MRLLVATLKTIENEYAACCESIARQTYTNFVHRTWSNLSMREAHYVVFQTFMESAHEFDLLIKVDADMVLIRPDLFQCVVDKFTSDPNLEQYQIAVWDYFTDRKIYGMNIYRNTLKWNLDGEQVFVERSGMLIRTPGALHVRDNSDLAPAANHCPDPSMLQAFHFGVHKGVKVREAMARDLPVVAIEHCDNILQTWAHYVRNPDRRLLIAVIGGELALDGRYSSEHINYENVEIQEKCNELQQLKSDDLHRLAIQLRRKNWGLLDAGSRVSALSRGWWRALTIHGIRKMILGPIKRSFFGAVAPKISPEPKRN